MPIPALALALGSLGLNLAGNIINKPQEPEFDIEKLMALLRESEAKNLSATTSSIAQTAGQNASARGLDGGAAAQIITQAQAPAVANSAASLNNTYADLLQKKMAMKNDYRNQKAQWLGGLFNDAAGAVSTYGAYSAENDSLSKLQKIFGIDNQTPKEEPKTMTSSTGQTLYKLRSGGYGGLDSGGASGPDDFVGNTPRKVGGQQGGGGLPNAYGKFSGFELFRKQFGDRWQSPFDLKLNQFQ